MLQQRLPGAAAERYQPTDPRFDRLQTLAGQPFSLMPEVSFLQVITDDSEDRFYTIVHNDAYLNNAQVFQEEQRRVPQEDYLTVVNGFIGSYPNVFFRILDSQLNDFVKTLESMRSEQDYANLVSFYGVRRTQPEFWSQADTFNAHYKNTFPRESGLFDLNRYENR
jgi:hypothetical protein